MNIARIASVAALGFAASLGAVGAAHAAAPVPQVVSAQTPSLATGTSSCALGDLCFWTAKSYAGTMGHVSGTNTDWRQLYASNCPGTGWNDCAQSAYNNGRSCTALLYDAIGGTGAYHTLARGDGTPDMYAGSYLKKVSANRWSC